jgi:hypothetical protein
MLAVLFPLLLAPNVVKADAVSAGIDERMAKHWQSKDLKPADACDDATFIRRATLDLAGRIPTVQEAKSFAADTTADKRTRAIRRLMESPEYALHLGRVLDEIVQDKYAGDGEFLEYLRTSVAKHKPWDQVFREVLLGPWDDKERKGASQFLLKRLKSLDELTTDTSRIFFGVNVSCAQCHDHPLVPDWKQDHYYGMASFFNRTAGKGGGKGMAGGVEEKTSGEVTFNTVKGERKTAKMMFLTSKVVDEAEAKKNSKGPFSRREQLVRIALEEKTFFSRAIVNQLWAFYLGHGLVTPVDQLHSANAPAVAGLLEWLADDFAANGYNLDRLVAGIVSSRVYQLTGTLPRDGKTPSDRGFARAGLRPLTPQQLTVSLLVATGDVHLDAAQNLDREAAKFTRMKLLDPRSDRYQTSTGEALFLSNHPDIQRLVEPAKTNLTGRLTAMTSTTEMVDTAVWTLLSRAPEPEERDYLVKWLESKPDRAKGCRQLVWALMTSAEFRFNH